MKQKFALSVADTEINVVTEESKEVIDTIVGIVDKRIKEIYQKSKNCPKSEAALLLCLDYCADKLSTQKKLKANESEIEKLKNENSELKKQLKAAGITSTKAQVQKIVQVPSTEEEPAQLTIDAIVKKPIEKKKEQKKPQKPAKKVETKAASKKTEKVNETKLSANSNSENSVASNSKISGKKVRSMFDMISFDDIND